MQNVGVKHLFPHTQKTQQAYGQMVQTHLTYALRLGVYYPSERTDCMSGRLVKEGVGI